MIGDELFIFGGYCGTGRDNSLYKWSFTERYWSKINYQGTPPCPRENNGAVARGRCFYIFGGYNGVRWLSDLHEYNVGTSGRPLSLLTACSLTPSPAAADPPLPRCCAPRISRHEFLAGAAAAWDSTVAAVWLRLCRVQGPAGHLRRLRWRLLAAVHARV